MENVDFLADDSMVGNFQALSAAFPPWVIDKRDTVRLMSLGKWSQVSIDTDIVAEYLRY